MYYKVGIVDDNDQVIRSHTFKVLKEAMDFVVDKSYTVPRGYNISLGLYVDGKLADSWDYDTSLPNKL